MAVFVRACDALDEYADHESRSITSGRLLTMTDDSNRRQPTNCHSSNHQTSMGCEESIRCCERVQSVQTCGTRVVTNRQTAFTRRSLTVAQVHCSVWIEAVDVGSHPVAQVMAEVFHGLANCEGAMRIKVLHMVCWGCCVLSLASQMLLSNFFF